MNALEQLLEPQTDQARQRRLFGLVTAKVAAIEDGGYYRLDYLSMGDGDQSALARMMMPMAGSQRGTYFFPEVGDEVVVGFELGDTSLPIILGAVWNQESTPPSQAEQSTDNNIRTIVSRSGHELTFDDTVGAESLKVKSQSGHTIEMDDAPGQGKITIKTAQGRTLLLDDTPPGKIALTSSGGSELTLDDAGGQMKISSPLKLEIKSQLIQIEGTLINLKTTGQVTTSAVIIDGKPFGVHTHPVPSLGTSLVVSP